MRCSRLITVMLLMVLVSTFSFPAEAGNKAARLTIERIFADPSLSGPSPRTLKISPDGSRVTFLKGKEDAREQLDLWEYNIDAGESRLLVDSRMLMPEEGALSEEERARRERKRISAFRGIVEYSWSDDGSALLFPLAGDIYVYDLTKPAEKAVKRLTETEEFELDAKFSPLGDYVSFIRDKDLFVI